MFTVSPALSRGTCSTPIRFSGTLPLPDQPRSYTEVLEIAPAEEEFATQAFHWGGLTAGSRLTAFWILLAPFAFANVAGWMSKDRTNRFGHAMIRLAGLGLTALFITQVFTATVLLPYLWLLGRSEFEILGRTFEVGDGLLRWAFLLLVVVLTGAFLILLLKASTQSHFEPRNTARAISGVGVAICRLHGSPDN